MPEFAKVSVTLPKDPVDSARARAGAGGFSAYVAEGLRLAEHLADLDEFLAAHEAPWSSPRPCGCSDPATIVTSAPHNLRALAADYPQINLVGI